MSRPHILILTASHLCRNPRVVKEASTLGAAGYRVTVLTVSSHTRFELVDEQFTRGLPFKRLTLDLTDRTRLGRLNGFYQRLSTWIARMLIRRFSLETAQALGPARALLRRAESLPSDLIIVHTEIPIWAASYLAKKGRLFAVDVEDWYSEDLLYSDRKGRPVRLLQRAEAVALKNGAYVSATSESMADALCRSYSCTRPIVIRNVFPLQKHCRLDKPPTAEIPSFIWFSQTIGPGRGLELFIAAWSRMRHESSLNLLGDERPGFINQIAQLIPLERRRNLKIHALVPPDRLPDKLAEFDIGLALERKIPSNRDITITNKIFQYMNAGLAVIATDSLGQTEIMTKRPGTGFLVDAHQTTRLAQSLDKLVTDTNTLRSMQMAARQAAIEEYCWEHESRVLLSAVARLLTGRDVHSPPP